MGVQLNKAGDGNQVLWPPSAEQVDLPVTAPQPDAAATISTRLVLQTMREGPQGARTRHTPK